MRQVTSLSLSRRVLLMALAVVVSAWATAGGQSRKFYDDDPLPYEPDTRDASEVEERDIDLLFDLTYNLFGKPGASATPGRAQNVNTIGEVPDSSWFTNRILAQPMSVDELLQGPNTIPADEEEAGQPGVVIRPKDVGMAPGFIGRDDAGEMWFVTFDPRGYPESATGALLVASKLFWALGYWQAEQYLTTLDGDELGISPEAQVRTPSGQRRRMRVSDLRDVIARAAPNADGTYRIVAARRISGRVVGGFRYHGTRSDDPNDIVPHEHRRELRALKVFGAWTNLVDIKAGNTLDTVITEDGRARVRHYLQDVGSTFGSGAVGPRDWDEGHEYLYEGTPFWKRLVSFGLWIRPWQTVPYERHPAVGRFEGEQFDPEAWRPRTPNGAFLNARLDDTFWAARRVMAFTDEMLRAVVKVAEFTNPADEQYLADVLIARRDKIGEVYLPAINPLVDFALDNDRVLRFSNAAVDAGVASVPDGYRAIWAEFDNETGETRRLGDATDSTASDLNRLAAPAELPTRWVSLCESTSAPSTHRMRRGPNQCTSTSAGWPGGWRLVGLERIPD